MDTDITSYEVELEDHFDFNIQERDLQNSAYISLLGMIKPIHPDLKEVLSSAEQLNKFFLYDGYTEVQYLNDRWHSDGARAIAHFRASKPVIIDDNFKHGRINTQFNMQLKKDAINRKTGLL